MHRPSTLYTRCTFVGGPKINGKADVKNVEGLARSRKLIQKRQAAEFTDQRCTDVYPSSRKKLPAWPQGGTSSHSLIKSRSETLSATEDTKRKLSSSEVSMNGNR